MAIDSASKRKSIGGIGQIPGVTPDSGKGTEWRQQSGRLYSGIASNSFTVENRRAISGIWIPLIPGVTPNSGKDAEWRQESGWSYSGISASVSVKIVSLGGVYQTTKIVLVG